MEAESSSGSFRAVAGCGGPDGTLWLALGVEKTVDSG